MDNTPTPHIGARKGEIADTVIMAGDPLRVKFMAENYLDNPVLFNQVRGMLGYTGTHDGRRISVMGHGMGGPSIGIYTYELFNFYDVQTIVRVGSAGAIQEDLHVGDLVIATGACTNSNYAAQYELTGTFAPIADFGLARRAVEACERLGYRHQVGNVLSSDFFYDANAHNDRWQRMGVLAIEMEIAQLYMNAAYCSGNCCDPSVLRTAPLGEGSSSGKRKKALGICTVSDHLLTGEATTAEERQTTFTKMMDVAFAITCGK